MGGHLAFQSIEGRDLLRRNTTGSAAVFEAAVRHSCRRVVFASTGFAYGFINGGDPAGFAPRYLPIDEEHPLVPTEHYGLSKQIGEQQIAMLTRASADAATGPTFVALRFPNSIWRQHWHKLPWPNPETDGGIHGGPIMWATVHEDDVIEAMLRSLDLPDEALELRTGGAESKWTCFNLAADDGRLDAPTMDLVERHWSGREGEMPVLNRPLGGVASIMDNSKARRVLGIDFRPVRADPEG